MHQLMLQFGDVEPFLTRVDVGTSTHDPKSSEHLNVNISTCHLLKVELAIVIDVGHPFIAATYR